MVLLASIGSKNNNKKQEQQNNNQNKDKNMAVELVGSGGEFTNVIFSKCFC